MRTQEREKPLLFHSNLAAQLAPWQKQTQNKTKRQTQKKMVTPEVTPPGITRLLYNRTDSIQQDKPKTKETDSKQKDRLKNKTTRLTQYLSQNV